MESTSMWDVRSFAREAEPRLWDAHFSRAAYEHLRRHRADVQPPIRPSSHLHGPLLLLGHGNHGQAQPSYCRNLDHDLPSWTYSGVNSDTLSAFTEQIFFCCTRMMRTWRRHKYTFFLCALYIHTPPRSCSRSWRIIKPQSLLFQPFISWITSILRAALCILN